MNLELLTNDAKYLISLMYKEYVIRRKNKIPKDQAVDFKDIEYVHTHLMEEWTYDDTLFTCRELKRQNMITSTNYGDDNMIMIRLSTEAIAIMENKFKDNSEKALDFAVKIKSLIPFI